jgi:hypothetical protein
MLYEIRTDALTTERHRFERRKMIQQWADYLDKLKAGEGQASGPSCCAEGGKS